MSTRQANANSQSSSVQAESRYILFYMPRKSLISYLYLSSKTLPLDRMEAVPRRSSIGMTTRLARFVNLARLIIRFNYTRIKFTGDDKTTAL